MFVGVSQGIPQDQSDCDQRIDFQDRYVSLGKGEDAHRDRDDGEREGDRGDAFARQQAKCHLDEVLRAVHEEDDRAEPEQSQVRVASLAALDKERGDAEDEGAAHEVVDHRVEDELGSETHGHVGDRDGHGAVKPSGNRDGADDHQGQRSLLDQGDGPHGDAEYAHRNRAGIAHQEVLALHSRRKQFQEKLRESVQPAHDEQSGTNSKQCQIHRSSYSVPTVKLDVLAAARAKREHDERSHDNADEREVRLAAQESL